MPQSFLSRKRYLGIPFYERRSTIDILGGLERYKTGIRQQVIAEATPTVEASAVSAAQNFITSFFYVPPVIKHSKGSGGAVATSSSSGAGYKGGTSPAAQSILSAAAKAKSKSISKSTAKKK